MLSGRQLAPGIANHWIFLGLFLHSHERAVCLDAIWTPETVLRTAGKVVDRRQITDGGNFIEKHGACLPLPSEADIQLGMGICECARLHIRPSQIKMPDPDIRKLKRFIERIDGFRGLSLPEK